MTVERFSRAVSLTIANPLTVPTEGTRCMRTRRYRAIGLKPPALAVVLSGGRRSMQASQLSKADASSLGEVFDRAAAAVDIAETFEEAARAVTLGMVNAFPSSIVLSRAYLTVPFGALPPRNAEWVRQIATAKGIEGELREHTQVISLVATHGRREEWNDRNNSKGHVGIPMASASFIDAIPMMSRLLRSLGGDLSWIDRNDTAHVISRLGTVSGTFYVEDAATEVDGLGRNVIPAADFVAENGVRTVFAVGGAFASGQLFVLMFFCSEHISRQVVDAVLAPFLRLKTALAPHLRRVFVDGKELDAKSAPVDQYVDTSTLDPSLDGIRASLEAKRREIAALNGLYLDLESQLESRTRALRMILENTGDGFALLNLDGSVVPGSLSPTVARWFGAPRAEERFSDYLFGLDGDAAALFALGLQSMVDGVMPFELVADQMPRRLERDARTYDLEFRRVLERGTLSQILVIMRDITDRIAAERSEVQSRERDAILKELLTDRNAFARFVDDSNHLVDCISQSSEPLGLRRDLHTLKGNVAIYGFRSLALRIHALEARPMNDQSSCFAIGSELRRQWEEAISVFRDFLDSRSKIELTSREYEDFLEKVSSQRNATLLEIARSWRGQPVGGILHRMGAQAQRLSADLEKSIRVLIEDDGSRVPDNVARAVSDALLHFVRNAVDHGIETAVERVSAGKPAHGTLAMSASTSDGRLVIVIRDDGRGIDWPKVRQAAESAGLQANTNLAEALFHVGLTTKEQVTTISGRGIGMSAAREALRSVRGNLELESSPGVGTMVRASVALDGAVHTPRL